jgi:hypothetical protein
MAVIKAVYPFLLTLFNKSIFLSIRTVCRDGDEDEDEDENGVSGHHRMGSMSRKMRKKRRYSHCATSRTPRSSASNKGVMPF